MWVNASWTELRALWAVLSSRRRRQCLATLTLALLTAAVEMISLALTYPWVAALIAPGTIQSRGVLRRLWSLINHTLDPHGYVMVLTIAFGAATLLAGGLRMTVLWVQVRVAYAIAGDLSRMAFGTMIGRPYEEHVSENSSVATSVVTHQVEVVTRGTILPVLSIIVSTFIMTALLAVTLTLASRLALYMFCGLALAYTTVSLLSRGFVRRDSEAVPRHHAHLVKLVGESVGGIRDIIIDRQQGVFLREFDRVDRALRRAVANAQILIGVPRFGIEALGLVTIATLAYVALLGGRSMMSVIPALGLLAFSAQRMLPVMQALYQGFVALRSSSGANRKLLAMIEPARPALSLRNGTSARLTGDLVLDHVTYTYPSRNEPALRDVSFTIPQGLHVGIVGPTGSGKSTLLDLILDLLTPQSGRITIGAVELDATTRPEWHAHVAHVPQDVFLIDASIAENIAFGIAPDAIDRDRLRDAAERAQILGEIERMPHGFATLAGERGALLSGGQRQRIGIARALYKGGSVFILDEATSALDPATEAGVMAALTALPGQPTIFIISHRPSVIAGCDRFIALDGQGHARLTTALPT